MGRLEMAHPAVDVRAMQAAAQRADEPKTVRQATGRADCACAVACAGWMQTALPRANDPELESGVLSHSGSDALSGKVSVVPVDYAARALDTSFALSRSRVKHECVRAVLRDIPY